MLWLDHGYLEGDDTDAHIDTLARFAAPDAIVFQACDDPADSHYAELQAMADEIAALRTRDGQPYRLFPLPWAQPIVDEDRRLAASYANFLIINGAVLMPAYGDAADAARAGRAGEGLPGPRDRRRALPPADLAERQPALHHHAVAAGLGVGGSIRPATPHVDARVEARPTIVATTE